MEWGFFFICLIQLRGAVVKNQIKQEVWQNNISHSEWWICEEEKLLQEMFNCCWPDVITRNKKMALMALASSWTRNRACHTPELFCGISKGLCGKNFPCWEFGKAASSSRGSGGMQGQHTLRYFPKQISLPPALPWEWDVIHSWVCSNCAFMSN